MGRYWTETIESRSCGIEALTWTVCPGKSFPGARGAKMTPNIFWIEGSWKGRLAIVPRPRGGDWLGDEVRDLKRAGISTLVSLLTQPEAEDFDLSEEGKWCQSHGIEWISFPVRDRDVPASTSATHELARRLEISLAEGKSVALHCRQGIGRSSLLAACILVLAGIDSATAFQRIREARGCSVPDTVEQRQWVASFAGSSSVRQAI